jgi:hypothetical protein
MPLTVRELARSREFDISTTGASLTLSFMVHRTEDEDEVFTALLTEAPDTFNGLVRGSIKPKPIGGGVWEADVEYKNWSSNDAAGSTPGSITSPDDATELGNPQGNGFTFEFDISQNTTHITQSITTTESKGPGGAAVPDYKKAIGVTKDGVGGCDIFDGKLEITLGVTRASVTLPYIRTLKGMVGKTNSAQWYGFAAGEVLYLGASGRSVSDGVRPKFQVSHRIGVGENQVNIDVGNNITILSKKAWQYLWCTYEEKEVGGILLQVPAAAYVETVFREGNFATLEIG